MVIGNDVAARVDNKARAQRGPYLISLLGSAALATLAAKEAIEKVLKILVGSALGLSVIPIVPVVPIRRRGRWSAVPPGVAIPFLLLLRQRFRIDIDYGGANLFAICVKAVDRLVGFGIDSGTASELSTCASFPCTPCTVTDPIRMPAERVPRMTKLEARRRMRSRSSNDFIRPNLVFENVAVGKLQFSEYQYKGSSIGPISPESRAPPIIFRLDADLTPPRRMT